jgi:hypothetical protein
MSNKELNDLVLNQEDRNYINQELDFIINQCQGIKESFNNSTSHFADTVCALPNTEMFYNKMSDFLDVWYDMKKEIRDRDYIKLNNQWLKKGNEVYFINLEDLNKLPIKTKCEDNITNDYGLEYYHDYSTANKTRIDKQIDILKYQIHKLQAQK